MPYWLITFGQPGIGEASDLNPDAYGITTSTKSLVVSILSAGTFFGSLSAYWIGDTMGRKWGLILACGIFSIGVAMQVASTAIPLFSAGRVIAGFGVGMVSCLVPMYQSECAPKWIRGSVVACYQWAITIGLLLAACANQGESSKLDYSAYRVPISLQFIWAAILATGMFLLPESPRYFVRRGEEQKALKSLSRILRLPIEHPEVQLQYSEIYANYKHERSLGKSSYVDCFRNNQGRNRVRVLTGMGLQSMQQWTGINFIFYYGTTYFQSAGISNAFIITIATNVVNVGATVPGIYLVEKLGRRKLLLGGAAVMCICEFIVGAVGTAVPSTNISGQRVLIAFVCIYIAGFAATWGPTAWVVTGEIYPLAIRAKAMSLSTASNWFWNCIIGVITPYLVDNKPGSAGLESKVFFIWGSMCMLCFLFAYFFIMV